MRIAHISDVHIRQKDRHKEYREVFERLYVKLKEQNPDRILLTGDIVHSKISLSPELVDLTTSFLMNLCQIAEVDMIVGNHDMNMSNTDRMDALTPIVNSVNDLISFKGGHKINYMTETGMYDVEGGKIKYGVYSLIDGKDIQLRKRDKEKGVVYIALHHGMISGCRLDNDYIIYDSMMSISTFNNFDFVMLGDIHKRQFLNINKSAAYAGSLIQQNHGESIEKGFLMWDIKTANDFTCDFIRVENDYAYYTIYADEGVLPDLDLPPKTRIRVIWSMNIDDISRAEASRLNSLIRSKYNPLSVQLSFKPISKTGLGDVEVDQSLNLANPDVQTDLLHQWFNNLDEDVDIDALMKIDRDISEVVTSQEFEDFSNSHWHLKKVIMENFMSYGESVEIDFDSMHGVIGLFGNNAAGKSVVIDAILYALFNKTTREVKNEDLVNKYTGAEVCTVKLQLVIKGVEYEIVRWTTRQYQKKSNQFVNARTDVTLNRRYNDTDGWENLTETTRIESEKIIRNAIGSFEDFMITTLSNQGGSTEFLKLKSSPRADIMLNLLGLDVFNKKYNHAKNILKQIEQERKSHNGDSEVELLDTKKKDLKKINRELKTEINKISKIETEIDCIRSDISKHTRMVNTTIKIEKDKDTLQSEFDETKKTIKTLEVDQAEIATSIDGLIKKMNELENDFILDEGRVLALTNIRDKADKTKAKITTKEAEITSNKRVLKVYRSDLENENKCPVEDDTRHIDCVYLSGYLTKKKECVEIINDVTKLQTEIKHLTEYLRSIEYVYDVLSEQTKIHEHMQKAVGKLRVLKSKMVECDNKLEVKFVSLNLIKSQLTIAKTNENTIRKNKEHKAAVVNLERTLAEEKSRLKIHEGARSKLSGESTLIARDIEDIEEILNKIKESDIQHNLFNTYCGAMHRKGLPVDILNGFIPKINYEINKILSDVVEFGVYLKIEDGETDVDIVMQYDGEIDDTRPAQMASGMEKLLINMAIRYSLLSVSNLNTPSSWFIDEGFGVLDDENLSAMAQFFDNVKGVFKNIVIITHIDALKDIANWVINIEKKGGISIVNSPSKNI